MNNLLHWMKLDMAKTRQHGFHRMQLMFEWMNLNLRLLSAEPVFVEDLQTQRLARRSLRRVYRER